MAWRWALRFQDIAANFISGVIIAVQQPFHVGDVIETDKFFGIIERISLRTLDIRQPTGELVIVPNRKVFENSLINFTQQTVRRVDIECGVGYDADPGAGARRGAGRHQPPAGPGARAPGGSDVHRLRRQLHHVSVAVLGAVSAAD
ncbi:MAG: mechanosensitive ion channel domain-containing protein [Hymenobacter sp.]